MPVRGPSQRAQPINLVIYTFLRLRDDEGYFTSGRDALAPASVEVNVEVRMISRCHVTAVRLLAIATAAALAACSGGAGFAPNQPSVPSSHSVATAQTQGASSVPSGWTFKPMYKVVQGKATTRQALTTSTLPLWNGSFVGTVFGTTQTYNFTMVGTDPSSTNVTTTVPVEIIPIKLIIGHKEFTPLKPLAGDRESPVTRILASPLFQSNVDFIQGGTDLGSTQYIDAFQRGNFWGSVQTNSNYHLLLTPSVHKEVDLRPVGSSGTIINGVGMVDFVFMDDTVQSLIKSLNVPPGTLPLFLMSGVYVTEFGDECCIGGWHNFTGTNTYAVGTYMPSTVNIPNVSGFSQNVSALSHEIGEWADDPLTNNVVCDGFGILEVGDPLENNPNFGSFPYTSNGFTYDLQDLTFLPYFGAPPSTSVNDFFTFQGETLGVCQNGG